MKIECSKRQQKELQHVLYSGDLKAEYAVAEEGSQKSVLILGTALSSLD